MLYINTMTNDAKDIKILPCVRSILCHDNRCPFGHNETRLYFKPELVLEDKYTIGPDYISLMMDDAIEHVISFLEDGRNMTYTSKRFATLRKVNYFINALPRGAICPFVPDYITHESKEVMLLGKELRHICLDPCFATTLIRDLSLYKKMSAYTHGLGIFYSRKRGFKRHSVPNEMVRLAIETLTDLKFIWYNNMAIDYNLCRHQPGLKELRISNCVFVNKCHIIDPDHKLQRLMIKNTIIHDEIVFPPALERLKLHVYYTRENLKSICRCNLLFLDIGFTRFICSFMKLFPATLRTIDLRTDAKNSLYAKKTLDTCNALTRLCTGYMIDYKVVETTDRLRERIIYFKYMRADTVVILHV
jgi:hypothetical protein